MTTVTRTQGSWANADFRRLWRASTVSAFGSEISELALPLLALVTLSASASEVALLRVAQFLPFLVATLPLGVVIDRHAHRRLPLMIAADLGRFVLFIAVPLAIWAGVAAMPLLYLTVFAAGILTVLYQTADFALLPSIVDTDQLVDANGKLAASHSASEIGGRGLGGLLVQAVSAPFAVAVDAVTFLGSAFSLRRIERRPAAQPAASSEERSQPARRDIYDGLRLALHNRYIRALVGEATTFNIFNEMFMLGLLLYAVGELRLGAGALGLVFTTGAVGSFAGAWFGSRLTGRFGYGRVLLITLILGNAAPIAVAWIGRAPGAALGLLSAIFLVTGVAIGIANVHAVSLRQAAVPEHLRGRVNAAYRLISWGAIPVGAGIGGIVAGAYGARTAMVVGAVGMSVATLWVAGSDVPKLRSIDEAATSS